AAESSLASGAGADASEAGEAVTEKRDQGDCLLLNNRGLLRLLQGDSRKALEYLWKAHTLCPTNETIEGNLKILLSRTPGP
ncbi:MAG: hypothetical protein KDK25_04495, partial [Leptospiraceae bacterium]|nr:hypothetical protein [Leptospiraceae bacterium]